MGFCTRCGNKKTEAGLCPKCDGGARRAPQPPPMQPKRQEGPYKYEQPRRQGHGQQSPPGYRGEPGYGQQPPPGYRGEPGYGQPPHGQPPHGQPGHGPYGGAVQHGYHQAMNSDFMQDVIAIVKGFFSKTPEMSFDRAFKTTNHIWLAFAGIYALLYGLVVIRTPVVIIREFAIWAVTNFGGRRSDVPSLRELREDFVDLFPMTQTEIFFRGLLFAVILFFIIYGVIRVMTNVVKPRILPASILNMAAVAMLPASVCMLAGLVLIELHGTFGLLVIMLGSIFTYVYLAVCILRIYGHIPYWAVAIGMIAFYVISYLVLRFILGAMVDDFLGEIL